MEEGDYSDWASIDRGAYDKFLWQRLYARNSAPKTTASPTYPKLRPNITSEVCSRFNAGACPSPCKNGRTHKCRVCSSEDHGRSSA